MGGEMCKSKAVPIIDVQKHCTSRGGQIPVIAVCTCCSFHSSTPFQLVINSGYNTNQNA
jgi:hypothetical protein